MTPEQKKNNLRLGLVLASIAVVFFLGFMAKLVFFGKG
ncbi:cytochrome oxidase small assembly protein [Polaromonas sp.]